MGTAAGLLGDSVSEVLRLPLDSVEPPLPMTGDAGSKFIRGVGKLEDRVLILRDIDKLPGHHGIHVITALTTNN